MMVRKKSMARANRAALPAFAPIAREKPPKSSRVRDQPSQYLVWPMRTFRAATLNIWHRSAPWEERLIAIREGMKTVNPDVIGLQEVLNYPGFDQAHLIAEGLGYTVAWAMSSPNHGYPVGNAIHSKSLHGSSCPTTSMRSVPCRLATRISRCAGP